MHETLKIDSYYLGLDIGGTKCAIVLGDAKGRLVDKIRFETKVDRGHKAILEEFKAHIKTLMTRYGPKGLLKIGVSCGGPLDSKKGIIKSPPNLPGWNEVGIVDQFEDEFGVPVALQNDANAGALAEWKMGAGQGVENMIFLTFGTGMGAGLILNGQIYSGANDLAGEIGHVRMADSGPIGFGKAGSFEGFCSGGGIAQLAKIRVREKLEQAINVGFCSSVTDLDRLDAKTIFEAAYAGDPLAMEIIETTAQYLGKGLALLVDIINPERIVIGSIYARNEALLRPLVLKVLKREAITAAFDACEIVPAKLGDKIGDYAALGVAMQ